MTTDYIATAGPCRAWMFALLLGVMPVSAAPTLTTAADLARDGQAAARHGAPVLVFFSMDGCPYCRVVEDLYLEPMVRRGRYAERLVIRVVHTSRTTPMTDFDGNVTTHAAFARAARATFTPTIRLYDREGRDLVEPLVGYTTPDFYSGYLESAIERAQAILGERIERACLPTRPHC